MVKGQKMFFENYGGEIMKFVVEKVKETKFACHVDQHCQLFKSF